MSDGVSSRDDGGTVARLRVPPHSIEAESSVLSGLILDNGAFDRVADVVVPADFYRHAHKLIYSAMAALISADKPIDVITVYTHLQELAKAEEVGGLDYLNSLAQYVPSAANIRRYAEIVRERSILRRLVALADETATDAYNPQGKSVDLIIDNAQEQMATIARRSMTRDPVAMPQALDAYLASLRQMAQAPPGIASGFAAFDRMLGGGMRPGQLITIGARPKVGKTALALAFARRVGIDVPVLFLSMEMSVAELIERHIGAMASIDTLQLRDPAMHTGDMWQYIDEARGDLAMRQLLHDDERQLTLSQVRRKVIQAKRASGDRLGLVVVDFLQQMPGADGGGDGGRHEANRNQELDRIVNGLKAMAGTLDVAVIALSQLNRRADERNEPPNMGHLRDSGAIEAASDVVMLLHRDHAHPLSAKAPNFEGFAEMHIVANRHGPTGMVPLLMVPKYQQFSEWRGPIPVKTAPHGKRVT